MYTGIVKNITISVDEDLWSRVHEAAAKDRISMNAFIRSVLARSLRRPNESGGERFANLAERIGPGPNSWKWNRDEIYEDAI